MIVLSGQLVDVSERQVSYQGREWTETTLHVLDGRVVQLVRAGKDFELSRLVAGAHVELEVWPRVYEGKRGPGLGWTAVKQLESVAARAA